MLDEIDQRFGARLRPAAGDDARDDRPARWRDIWSAGHSTSGVTGVPPVDDLVAQTIAEFYAEGRV